MGQGKGGLLEFHLEINIIHFKLSVGNLHQHEVHTRGQNYIYYMGLWIQI